MRISGRSFPIELLLFTSLLGLGCSQSDSHSDQPAATSVPEEAFCSAQTYSGSTTTVTGTAQYKTWSVTTSGLSNPVLTNPIRGAEVRLVDGAGAIAQCGNTAADGTFSLIVPKAATSYTVQVNSRGNSSTVKASVLDGPTTNLFYKISTTVSLTGGETTISAGTLLAPHNGSLEGGAFNIFDQIYKTNEFLRNHSGNCTGCTTFTVAPKVNIFWKPGFDPGVYISTASETYSGISFFYVGKNNPDLKGLYILGGNNGDTANNDTDHFDNSIIIHEYGHYLENTYASTDSPGGSHFGVSIIDPRLAWGEGWANFFGSVVQSSSIYRDTLGNPEGNGSLLVNIDLKVQNPDVPTALGEGMFRELSVSRALYDNMDNTDGESFDFSYYWKAFTGTSPGFKSSTTHFRNAGLFFMYLKTILTSLSPSSVTGLNNALTAELQRSDRTDYAAPLASGSCTLSLTGKKSQDLTGDGTIIIPDLFRTYDMYQIDHAGGTLNYKITYTPTGSPQANLDLYLYVEDHELYNIDSTSWVNPAIASSARAYPESGTGVEEITVSGLAAGTYLLVVQVNTSSGRSTYNRADYQIYSNGVQVCPNVTAE